MSGTTPADTVTSRTFLRPNFTGTTLFLSNLAYRSDCSIAFKDGQLRPERLHSNLLTNFRQLASAMFSFACSPRRRLRRSSDQMRHRFDLTGLSSSLNPSPRRTPQIVLVFRDIAARQMDVQRMRIPLYVPFEVLKTSIRID